MGQIGLRVFLAGGRGFTLILSLFLLFNFSVQAKEYPIDEVRDPGQLTVMVGDFDGTFAKNIGSYRLRRAAVPGKADPYFMDISGLPEEVLVPVNDFEGNTGPRIGMLLGNLNGLGHFVPSTAIQPVKLSNGGSIIPAYYYMEPQYGYREFRPPADGEKSFLVKALEEKFRNEDPFLLEAFPFMSLAFDKAHSDRIKASILTRRGHDPQEEVQFFSMLRKKFKLGTVDWPEEAFINLSSPRELEFGFSKGRYVQQMYYALSEKVMEDHTVPHYLVVFENDIELIKEIDDMFRRVSSSGVFSSPVVPVLVNLVEPEVFEYPDGKDWKTYPLAEFTKMSRITTYKPGGEVFRTNNLAYLYEMILGISEEEGKAMLRKQMENKFVCRHALVELGEAE